VIPSLHGDVLAVLSRVEVGLTGRTIARLAGDPSAAGVARVLKELVRAGVVRATPAGTAIMYELNRDHVAAGAIISLGHLRETVIDRIREAVREMRPKPVFAYLFGSAVRQDGDADSDIDILLVQPDGANEDDWDVAVADLADYVLRFTGNPAGIVVFTEDEFGSADDFLETVRREGLRLL
jgi:predicted nucleotidyltransferase